MKKDKFKQMIVKKEYLISGSYGLNCKYEFRNPIQISNFSSVPNVYHLWTYWVSSSSIDWSIFADFYRHWNFFGYVCIWIEHKYYLALISISRYQIFIPEIHILCFFWINRIWEQSQKIIIIRFDYRYFPCWWLLSLLIHV